MRQKLVPDPFLILVNNPEQLLHARSSFLERGLSKGSKKVNFFSFWPYVTCMSLVCTRMSSVCHSHVLVCHFIYSCVIRVSLVCHSHVLVCHPYVTRMYSHVIRMSLVCGFTNGKLVNSKAFESSNIIEYWS